MNKAIYYLANVDFKEGSISDAIKKIPFITDDGKQVVEVNQNIGLSVKKALGVIGGVTALKQLGSEIIRVRGEFQSMQTDIETLVGKDMASKLIPQIKEFAKVSPLTMTDMVGAEKMMLGFNIKAEDTIRYLQALGDISMGNSQKFNSLTLAFSQMSATGKLMGQDLNQMINAGFNPLQTISEKTGKSIASLKEEMSKGAVSAEMVQQAFIDATSAGGKFYKMSENASKTINGQLSMLQDAIDVTFNEMGKKSEGFITGSIQTTTKLVENYESIGKIVLGLVAIYGTYRTAMIVSAIVDQGFTKSVWAKVTATKAATAAEIMYQNVLKMNPYVRIGSLVIALGVAVLALADNTTAAERAQRKLNDAMKSAAEAADRQKSNVDKLISTLRDENASTVQKQKAYLALQKMYPSIFGKYKTEKELIESLTNAQNEFNSALNKGLELRGKKQADETKQVYDNYKRYLQLLEKLRGQKNPDINSSEYKKFQKSANLVSLSQRKNGGFSEKMMSLEDYARKRLKETGDLVNQNQAKQRDGYQAEELASIKSLSQREAEIRLKENRELIERMNKENKKYIQVNGIVVSKDNLIQQNNSLSEKINEQKKTASEWLSSYKKAYQDAEKDYSNFLSSKQVMSESDRNEELKRLKGIRDAAKTIYESNGGSISSDNKDKKESLKRIEQERSARIQEEKLSEIEKKNEVQHQRQQEDSVIKFTETYIDAMDDGYNKRLDKMALDHEKEMMALKRQEEDKLEALRDMAQKEYENDPKNQKNGKLIKPFDRSSVSFSEEEKRSNEVQQNATLAKQFKERVDLVNEYNDKEKQAWINFYKEYGTVKERRLAIEQDYDRRLKEASKDGNDGQKAILEKEKANALDEFDNSIKNSTTLMGELFADTSKKSVTEIQKIIDKAELLMKYLASVKDENGNANIDGKTVTKNQILGLGISDNTLQNLELSTDQVESLKNAISSLKSDLGSKSPFLLFKDQIRKAVDTLNKGGDGNIAQGMIEMGDSVAAFSPAVSQFGKDLGNIFGSDDLGNKIAGISDAIGGLGKTAAGAGQIMSGDIVGGAMSAVSGISSVVSALDGLFGADYSHYNKMKAEYDALSSIWDILIEKKQKYVDITYGNKAKDAGVETIDLLNKEKEKNIALGLEKLNSGASAGSHSIGIRQRRRITKQGWNEIAAASEKIGFDLNAVTDGRMTGLFKLSGEQLDKLQEQAPTFWAKLDGDVKEYLQGIIDCTNEIGEMKEKMKEATTGVSFDSFRDSYLDAILDMDSTNEDLADNLSKYLQKAVLSSMFANEYSDEMRKLYDKWALYSGDKEGLTPEEANKLKDDEKALTEAILKRREQLAKDFGWETGESSSQSATAKGFQAMSQDTGNELNGRFTGLQIAGEETKNQNILQTQSLNLLTMKSEDILRVSSDIRDIASETRDIIANSYLELVQISENTGAIIKPIKEMASDMKDVKKNTSKL